MKLSKVVIFVPTLALALSAAPALAHGLGGGGACRPLVQALCPDVTPGPGPGGYASCLQALCPNLSRGPGGFASCLLNQTKIPITNYPKCQTQLTDLQAKVAAWQAAFNTACSSDVSQFCANVTTGPRGQIRCLNQAVKDNKAVSGTCQTFLANHHGHPHHWHGWREAAPGSSSNP
jgi:hypothetical protein